MFAPALPRLSISDSPQIFKLLGAGTNTALVNSLAVGVTKAVGVIIGARRPLVTAAAAAGTSLELLPADSF